MRSSPQYFFILGSPVYKANRLCAPYMCAYCTIYFYYASTPFSNLCCSGTLSCFNVHLYADYVFEQYIIFGGKKLLSVKQVAEALEILYGMPFCAVVLG